MGLIPQTNLGSWFFRRPWVIGFGVLACPFLAFLSVFIYKSYENDLKIHTAKTKALDIAKACEHYNLDHSEYPDSLDDLIIQNENGKGPYLKSEALMDPWGKRFNYDKSGQMGNGNAVLVPDIFCQAPDGRIYGNFK